MISLNKKTSTELNKELARRIAGIRKRRKLSQSALALKSGVSLGSLKRFEQTGGISLQSLTKIAMALELDGELEQLFTNVPFMSIEEVLREQEGDSSRAGWER